MEFETTQKQSASHLCEDDTRNLLTEIEESVKSSDHRIEVSSLEAVMNRFDQHGGGFA